MIDHALALTHIDERGAARMVDVSEKPVTLRVAKASGLVIMKPSTLRMISDGAAAKGDVMAAARIAGIAAAKRTGDLIPLCHPLGLDAVSVTITPCEPDRVKILATTTTLGRTGVEMEALTAVSVAALTIYDMCKAVDRAMEISQIVLQEKSGGRSGVPMSGILLINSSKNTLAFAIIVSEYRWRSTNSSRRCRPFSAMVMRSPSSRR